MSVVLRLFERLLRTRAAPDSAPRKTPLVLNDDAFIVNDGLPHPRWDFIRSIILNKPKAFTLHEYYCDAVEAWLTRLGEALGPQYRVAETRNFMMLGSVQLPPVLHTAEKIRDEIIKLLGSAAWSDTAGKHVVIGFDNEESYYTYLSHFDTREGQVAGSGGVCISGGGYVHIALPTLRNYEGVLAHELTHNLLAHRRRPAWLEEGIATIVEHHYRLYRASTHGIDARQMRLHRRYWRRYGLSDFWQGKSFGFVGGQRLSYELAVMIVKVVIDHARGDFGSFVTEAARTDCGEKAALKILGQPLEYFASRVLGDGEWAVNNAM